MKARDAVYEEVMAKGWSKSRGSFVQSFGSDALDASALLMPLTDRGGLAADGLVYRYDPRVAPDGLPWATSRRPSRIWH